MAIVTGSLLDFSLGSIASRSPRIIFTPSSPGTLAGALLSAVPIVAIPAADGSFSVQIIENQSVHPETWYTIRVEWLDPNSYGPNQGYKGVDFIGWKLFVPPVGGAIGDLLSAPSNPAQVWEGEEPPPEPVTPGTWWLIPSTGDLLEWSN